jgi:hypothetical protein
MIVSPLSFWRQRSGKGDIRPEKADARVTKLSAGHFAEAARSANRLDANPSGKADEPP